MSEAPAGRGRRALGALARTLAWLAALIVAFLLLGPLIGRISSRVAATAVTAGIAVAISVAAWCVLDRRSPAGTPLSLGRRGARSFGRGLAAGAAAAAIVVLVLAASGAFSWAGRSCGPGDEVAFAGSILPLFLLAALFEEIVFHGYPLFTLRQGMGAIVAVATTSVLFSVGHASNPGYGPSAALTLVLVGAALALWALRTDSLWTVTGLHAGWNLALALGAAIPVSGLAFPAPCHVGMIAGPRWLTGGAFGVEAGIPTALVWAAIGLLALRKPGRTA